MKDCARGCSLEEEVGIGEECRGFCRNYIQNGGLRYFVERVSTINFTNNKGVICLEEVTDEVGYNFASCRYSHKLFFAADCTDGVAVLHCKCVASVFEERVLCHNRSNISIGFNKCGSFAFNKIHPSGSIWKRPGGNEVTYCYY